MLKKSRTFKKLTSSFIAFTLSLASFSTFYPQMDLKAAQSDVPIDASQYEKTPISTAEVTTAKETITEEEKLAIASAVATVTTTAARATAETIEERIAEKETTETETEAQTIQTITPETATKTTTEKPTEKSTEATIEGKTEEIHQSSKLSDDLKEYFNTIQNLIQSKLNSYFLSDKEDENKAQQQGSFILKPQSNLSTKLEPADNQESKEPNSEDVDLDQNEEAQRIVTITYAINPVQAGTVSTTSESGEIQNIVGSTASANPGYQFVNWTDEDGKEISTDPTLSNTQIQTFLQAHSELTTCSFTANFTEEPENPENVETIYVYAKVIGTDSYNAAEALKVFGLTTNDHHAGVWATVGSIKEVPISKPESTTQTVTDQDRKAAIQAFKEGQIQYHGQVNQQIFEKTREKLSVDQFELAIADGANDYIGVGTNTWHLDVTLDVDDLADYEYTIQHVYASGDEVKKTVDETHFALIGETVFASNKIRNEKGYTYQYAKPESIIFDGTDDHQKLVLYYQEDEVTIYYKADSGGTVNPTVQDHVKVISDTVSGSLATPQKGYAFDHWSVQNENGTQSFISNQRRFVPSKIEGLNVSATYTAHFAEDKIGGTNPDDPYYPGDGIPDQYEATLIYKIENGTWKETGNSQDLLHVIQVARLNSQGEVEDLSDFDRHIPTGMIPNQQSIDKGWTPDPAKQKIEPGKEYVFTYTFEPISDQDQNPNPGKPVDPDQTDQDHNPNPGPGTDSNPSAKPDQTPEKPLLPDQNQSTPSTDHPSNHPIPPTEQEVTNRNETQTTAPDLDIVIQGSLNTIHKDKEKINDVQKFEKGNDQKEFAIRKTSHWALLNLIFATITVFLSLFMLLLYLAGKKRNDDHPEDGQTDSKHQNDDDHDNEKNQNDDENNDHNNDHNEDDDNPVEENEQSKDNNPEEENDHHKDKNGKDDSTTTTAIKKAEEKHKIDPDLKRKGFFRLLSILSAIASVFLFVWTEDMSLPMVIMDQWTLCMFGIALINVVILFFTNVIKFS